VIGLLAAVIARQSTGQGQHVDISMTDCAFSLHAMAGAGYLAAGQEPDMENQALNGGSFYDYYRTRDGRWLSVGSLEPQFMQQFCAAIGRPELAALGLSPKDQKALKREIEIEIEKHDLADWQQRFAALDACVEPVLKLSEAVEHPQLKARGVVTEVPREGRAAQRQLACPIRFSQGLEPPRHIGVAVGAHSDEVLRELGYDAEQIAALRASKALA
jgi:crotonobetainyl-CoA:carnitine CoA-transferase CaiB-like acyl-CoA transferase